MKIITCYKCVPDEQDIAIKFYFRIKERDICI